MQKSGEKLSGGLVAAPPQIVQVKRDVLVACMTCPLCNKLLRDATTISECLHTFCRKCIFEKLTDEDEDCCPICHIDLSCIPLEKLRPDHNLQDLRAKIFPYKRREINDSEIVTSITLPVRRKERSLSSLGINTLRVGAQSYLTGGRTKAVARRASTIRGPSPGIGQPKKKGDDNDEDVVDSSSPEKFFKIAHCRKQLSSNAETSTYNKYTKNGSEIFIDKSELWKPLNCLVEAANTTKCFKSSPQTSAIKAEPTNGLENESHMYRMKVREHPCKLKIQDDENNNVSTSSAMVKARRMHGINRKRKGQVLLAQAVLDASDAACERMICPVWLSLLSSSDKKGDTPLPQISASYLRIKEGNLPVSLLQKYLVKKLNLASEAEVEIACRGELVSPTLSLNDLTEQWLRHGPSQRVLESVGTSAKDYVMVLTYSRKTESP